MLLILEVNCEKVWLEVVPKGTWIIFVIMMLVFLDQNNFIKNGYEMC